MSDHRWQGYTHAELFELLHQGPGPSASGASAHRWRELETAFREIDDGMAATLKAVAADWEGEASDSVRRGLLPLREWADEVTLAATRMRQCSEHQAELVARARAEMPPPVRVTAEEPNAFTSTLVHLFGGQTDYELREQQQHAAEQRAFDVMRRYQAASEANTTSLASFETPPQVVVDAPSGSSPGGGGAGRGDITISWTRSYPEGAGTGGSGAGPGRSGAGGGNATPSSARPAEGSTRGGSLRSGSRNGSASGTHGVAAPRTSRAGWEEERDLSVEATESEGGTGPFDEHRVSARPVIGGEP
ncbi:PPE family protein [Actinopolyspora mzabensis]|uniref:PPE family protein n=1 Tax=Actinopolyspora mzabensis TaxID=995066 RepID=A0A1G9CYS5_ACTMZ|nr:PPE domain-containing protein [Actinopolyspora mzabensis]SDK56789.1 PPE family protein [Actinopolyspora mzabensis]